LGCGRSASDLKPQKTPSSGTGREQQYFCTGRRSICTVPRCKNMYGKSTSSGPRYARYYSFRIRYCPHWPDSSPLSHSISVRWSMLRYFLHTHSLTTLRQSDYVCQRSSELLVTRRQQHSFLPCHRTVPPSSVDLVSAAHSDKSEPEDVCCWVDAFWQSLGTPCS
jgi:hypothetical protein